MAEDAHPAVPRSLALMGGPIDSRIGPTTPDDLATNHDLPWFRHHMIHEVPPPYPGATRRVYPGFMQLGGFMSMNLDRHIDAYWNLFRSIRSDDTEQVDRHRRFYDEYLAEMDLPARFLPGYDSKSVPGISSGARLLAPSRAPSSYAGDSRYGAVHD